MMIFVSITNPVPKTDVGTNLDAFAEGTGAVGKPTSPRALAAYLKLRLTQTQPLRGYHTAVHVLDRC